MPFPAPYPERLAQAAIRISDGPQPNSVAPRRGAEQATIFPAKLRRAIIPHIKTDGGDVMGVCHEAGASLLEADLLLILDRAHRGYRAKMAVKGRNAHRRELRQFLDAQHLRIMSAKPPDGVSDLREPDRKSVV